MNQKFERKISKAGDSLNITIPVAILRELGLKLGDTVLVGMKGNQIYFYKKKGR